jgi:hypothetical protein
MSSREVGAFIKVFSPDVSEEVVTDVVVDGHQITIINDGEKEEDNAV